MRQIFTFFLLAIASTFLVTFSAFSQNPASIAPDATLPTKPTVTVEDNKVIIDGGIIEGKNLFYSFSEFSVPTDTEVEFKNSDNIENIFGCITGKNASQINGLIKTNNDANLFIINPNGTVFEATASLNINGSFVASSANSIQFEDGTLFSAFNSTQPVLTASKPIGLVMGTNSGSIMVMGDGKGLRTKKESIDTKSGLRVPSDKTIALVGSDLRLEGATLKTAGGRIELGSVTTPDLVRIASTEKGISLGYQDVSKLGNIQLSGSTAVDASGDRGGDLQVIGMQVKLNSGAQLEASTLGDKEGGNIVVIARDRLELMGMPGVDEWINTGIATDVYEGVTGNGGNLKIDTRRLIVRDDALISASTLGEGNAGSIEILARDLVEVTRKSSSRPGSAIATVADRNSSGAGGNLTITTGMLTLRDGGVLSVGTYGKGKAGNLSIKAKNVVELTGMSLSGQSPSNISALTRGDGNGGNLAIETGLLSVRAGTKLTASSEESKNANAGSVEIKAEQLQLQGNSAIAATANQGNGGKIRILAKNVSRSPDSQISANSELGKDGVVNLGNRGSRKAFRSSISSAPEASPAFFNQFPPKLSPQLPPLSFHRFYR
jgi:filamentous hemagglutinin family protein